MTRWVSAICDSCGWKADSMMLDKAKDGLCPYCNMKKLRPL